MTDPIQYESNFIERIRANSINIRNPYEGNRVVNFITEKVLLDPETEELQYSTKNGSLRVPLDEVYTDTIEYNGNTYTIQDMNEIITAFFVKWYNERKKS